MEAIKMKKDMQKFAKRVRDDLSKKNGYEIYYPKAVMTMQQVSKRTATINFGETHAESMVRVYRARANEAFTSQEFADFCRTYNAKAFVETVNVGGGYTKVQIRINY